MNFLKEMHCEISEIRENQLRVVKNYVVKGERLEELKTNKSNIKQHNDETIKLLEDFVRGKLLDIGLGNDFLDLTPKAKVTIAKINKWEYVKLKSFCTGKETVDKMKNQPTELEKRFTNYIS